MISRKTVFVTGAGASAPYGFPLGSALKNEIVTRMSKQNSPYEISVRMAAGADPNFAREFTSALRQSDHQGGVDEFIQWFPQFREIAKHAIAAALAPCESDAALEVPDTAQPANPGGPKWYEYLFGHMIRSRSGKVDLADNALSVVTFNFDRSFQRALHTWLRRNCPGVASEAAAIPVFPLHGQLGRPDWIADTRGSDAAAQPRAYGTTHFQSDDERWADIAACARQIRIVDEEVAHSDVLEEAQQRIREADTVCFLGFSYHGSNLSKIGMENLRGRMVHGTTFGMKQGPRDAVRRAFKEANVEVGLKTRSIDTLGFLEQTDLIYD